MSTLNLQLAKSEPLYEQLLEKLENSLKKYLKDYDPAIPASILDLFNESSKDYIKEQLKELGEENADKFVEGMWEELSQYAEGKRPKKKDEEAEPPKVESVVVMKNKPPIEGSGVSRIMKLACRDAEESIKESEGAKRKEGTEEELQEGKKSILERVKKVQRQAEKEESAKKTGSLGLCHKKRSQLEETTPLAPVSIKKDAPYIISLNQANNGIRAKKKIEEKQIPSLQPEEEEDKEEDVSKNLEKQQEGANNKSGSQKEKDKKKIRCKNWPACPDKEKCE